MEILTQRKTLNIIICSMKYDSKPSYIYRGVESVIMAIMEQCVQEENGRLKFNKENILINEILGNENLANFGYTITDEELQRRFSYFWMWYEPLTHAEKINKDKTLLYFKKLLLIGETIANDEIRWKVKRFQKSITYLRIFRDAEFAQLWKNEEVTQMIINKFIERKQWETSLEEVPIDEYDLENTSEDSKDSIIAGEEIRSICIKDIKKKLRREGLEIDQTDIMRAVRLGLSDCVKYVGF
jgi:hypothetical protein